MSEKVLEKTTIVIVDDHPLFRAGIKDLIRRNPEFLVVAEAGSCQEGIEAVRREMPDMVLVDVSLPDRSGIRLIRAICSENDKILPIIVSMHTKGDYVSEGLQAGARGYVVKESAADQLLKAIETVRSGEIFLDASIAAEAQKKKPSSPEPPTEESRKGYDSLTRREREVMRLVVEGLSSREIAKKLIISVKTVETHRANLLKKLGVHNSVELIRYAVKLGLVEVDR